ncbi:sodium-translocating pyrophosphatase [Tessaracoccus sp. ZS01]|uniref:sodium-translocating pyrophosphatase n=1 Tax=Tessaracoccus sp. ZS01 TaxID=1906324 RepID=UPI00096FF2B2|nr:sodium-translocating pyrophosphatase [Tessaracoccus sp. ZS01]MCG6567562.1 sodium-translocating pyrophosphatase [Tessaracoccus sp. ZS01]OMG55926.1 sodium-translocating pyrophosphatase [Tessaracoccus sp. ZS01]
MRRARWAALAIAGLTALGITGCAGDGAPPGETHVGGEANLQLPDLGSVDFLGIPGSALLGLGLIVCALGLGFGLMTYTQLKRMPAHSAMREISELIYTTCKAYLKQQGKFLLVLWAFIAAIIIFYYLFLVGFGVGKTAIVIAFSLIGMAGSYGVAWYGIRVNTLANSRTAHAALGGKPYPCHDIPLRSGMSIGMVLISVELAMMLIIMVFLPGEIAGACFIGFAIGESLGASALRIAGGIFTKIADIGADLMKIVFKIKEDDARNPGVIADCTGDNAGDSVGPSADGFETYGVTGVALITFILIGVPEVSMQVTLLVWLFVIRAAMVVASGISYFANRAWAKARYANADDMDFEAPLTSLVWITSVVCIATTFLTSILLIGNLEGGLWWKLSLIVSCGTLAGALIPELVKVFTSTSARHTQEVVISSNKGGPSLGILSGLVSGNFSAYWLGMAIAALMAVAYGISTLGLSDMMLAPAVFAFGLVAFGFLGMGPVTIAVDSYGPVTDNAQSVFELSTVEHDPSAADELATEFGHEPDFERAKYFLEANDGAGNTFKATAKPVLIGTAVVGATTMIFSIMMGLTDGLENAEAVANLSLLHAPFLLGLLVGGAVIYWFTGASIQAVTTGAYRAVEFIGANIKLDGVTRASEEDSAKVVQICTQYAQKGMFNIFLGVFFSTLAFAFVEPFFFIGYLIAMALFGLYQAIFMANAGGAWDNAKKIVEVDLDAKGTALHDATIIGDTVGDPYKDTSSVALNPVIKFTTLFGLLAVELAVSLNAQGGQVLTWVLAAAFFFASLFFVHRSFYGMRINENMSEMEIDRTTEAVAIDA